MPSRPAEASQPTPSATGARPQGAIPDGPTQRQTSEDTEALADGGIDAAAGPVAKGQGRIGGGGQPMALEEIGRAHV